MIKRVRQFFADWTENVRTDVAATDEGVAFCLSVGDLEVGRLQFENDQWLFNYSAAFRQQTKIKPIVDFPDKEKEYRSPELWPFFLLRVPSLKQPAVQEFLRSRNIESTDAATLLKEFGQRSIANPFELIPA